MATVTILVRTETLSGIDAFSYLLGCDIVMMRPLVHVLILLEVVDLLVLAVRGAHSLLTISNSFLEKDTAGALHVRAIALASFVHMLEIMLLRHSLRLCHHTRMHILVLHIVALLVCHVRRCLSGLPHSEFKQLLDILWGDLWRGTLPDLDDLALRIIVRLWRILLHDSGAII